MELVTAEQRRRLIDNWNLVDDIKPVVKVFSPVGSATWLIASMNSAGRRHPVRSVRPWAWLPGAGLRAAE